jgi:hypothetical protein
VKAIEVIHARGHPNIRSTHRSTLQITKEATLTERGDCIIAVAATKAIKDLSPKFKQAARHPKAQITVIIETDGVHETIKAKGNPRLPFAHPTDLVIRKSSYVCSRTLAINADKAARDLPKQLIKKLQNPKQKVKITLIAETQTV